MPKHETGIRNNEANVYNSFTMHQGYLYIPFAAPDLVDQSLGLNLHRHLKGKTLYPLIAADQSVLEKFKEIHTAEIIKLTKQITTGNDKIQLLDTALKNEPGWNANTLRNTVSHQTFDTFFTSFAKLSQQLSVLKRISFSHIRMSQLSPERDKLYVLGHGHAGLDLLAAGETLAQEYITARTLAEQMKRNGLPKTFKDLRITTCYSADSMKPKSFSPEDLDKASGIFEGSKEGIRTLFNPLKKSPPLAQSISREFHRLGYENIQVTGYHGAGVTFSQDEYRTRRIEGVADIRRSLVKCIF